VPEAGARGVEIFSARVHSGRRADQIRVEVRGEGVGPLCDPHGTKFGARPGGAVFWRPRRSTAPIDFLQETEAVGVESAVLFLYFGGCFRFGSFDGTPGGTFEHCEKFSGIERGEVGRKQSSG